MKQREPKGFSSRTDCPQSDWLEQNDRNDPHSFKIAFYQAICSFTY